MGEGPTITGKEEDVEVGLTYFGKRFYNAALQRWVSADPLEVHQPGSADDNVYAYVQGMALRAVDVLGLEPVVSYQSTKEYNKPVSGTARRLAQALGIEEVGVHNRTSGLVEQVAQKVKEGRTIDRVDSLGHAASGFATGKSIYQFDDYLAKRLAPYLQGGAKVIIHGCGPTRNTEAFVRNLGSDVTVYTHDIRSGPGMPMNWVKHTVDTDANGGRSYVKRELSGADRVVGEILPESYVKWWVGEQSSGNLKQWIDESKKGGVVRMTDDVRDIMQNELSQRASAQPAQQSQQQRPSQGQAATPSTQQQREE
jgi:RHS repeat-associated protein